ncbi:CDP-alcohol phosphatidyltransferase family protein [Candidatus Woesearchaeota archaeon]|nr:CDP-alcohol phosphatidyltransferase family protein [Candidatus Woesearchaeota archaeon]
MDKWVNGMRVAWNPLSRYYVEPMGNLFARLLSRTPITPNIVTISNLILSAAAGLLLISGIYWQAVLFVVWVPFFHAIDVADGVLARLTKKKSSFGSWIDRAGDRFVLNTWAVLIGYALFAGEKDVLFLFAVIAYLFGKYLYSFLSLTSDLDYPGHGEKDALKANLKKNPLVWLFLFFLDYDIQLHLLMLAGLLQRLDIWLLFYGAYFNIVWVAYVLYYGYKHLSSNG